MPRSRKYDTPEIRLVEPGFDSPLTDLIIELDYLRKRQLGGTTEPLIFFQLKSIFHWLESLSSARIEGNHTTIAEFIETKIETPTNKDEKILEIQNMEKALELIDQQAEKGRIDKLFLSELHKLVTFGLTPTPAGEGSKTPGQYRKENVKVAQSKLVPPDFTQVEPLMEELIEFINRQDLPKYDLIKTALAHHRFAWIHPFDNGNGRTVRLLTYALLVKQGFNIHKAGRIVNPSAIFCMDRNMYYEKLSQADSQTDKDLIDWCEYVLRGLRVEIEKIDKLSDYAFLASQILSPAIDFAQERKLIREDEEQVLRIAVEKQIIRAGDLKSTFPDKSPPEISRVINSLKKKKMLAPEKYGGRKYVLWFQNSYLLRGIIKALEDKGFLPFPANE